MLTFNHPDAINGDNYRREQKKVNSFNATNDNATVKAIVRNNRAVVVSVVSLCFIRSL